MEYLRWFLIAVFIIAIVWWIVGIIDEKTKVDMLVLQEQEKEENKQNDTEKKPDNSSYPQFELSETNKSEPSFTQFEEINKEEQKAWRMMQKGFEPEIHPATKVLTDRQKHSVMELLAFVQGTSPLSIYDDEANMIFQETITSLGLTRIEVEKILRQSMSRDGESEADNIIDALHTIEDKEYLRSLYRKVLTVARISEDKDTIANVRNIFNDLNI